MTTSVSPLRKVTSDPFHVILALSWLATVAGAVGSWILGWKELNIVVGFSGFAYMVILIWVFARKKPHSTDLPDLGFLVTPRMKFGVAATGLLLAIGVVLVMGMMIGTAMSLVSVSALIAAAITLSWRDQLSKQMVLIGVAFSLTAGFGILFLGNGDVPWAIFNGLATLPLFTGGALLASRTKLAESRLLQGQYAFGFKGFLWACILALPAAFFNLLGNLQQGDTWLTHWWQPLYAIVPAITEETWARLFFTTFCYAVLRPADNQHPRKAIVLSVLAGALVHSFAHTGINPLGLIIGGLLYFIPAALLFIKYDFEHAIGYHFLIDLVRFTAALFAN